MEALHKYIYLPLVIPGIIILLLQKIDKCRAFSNFKLSNYKHLASYEEFVTSLGIPGFSFYIGQTSKQLKCRTLTGPKKVNFLNN